MTLPLRSPAFADRVEPFLAEQVLDAACVHLADELGALAEVADPDVLLGCALAIRAPHYGHVAADLSAPPTPEPTEDRPEPPELPWPTLWPAAPALIRDADEDEDRETPFVRRGDHLYLDRYWSYQQDLADRLLGLAHDATDPGDLAHLTPLFPEPTRQRLAAAQALRRRLSVISGGPGTGKTTTVRNILALLYARSMAATGEPPSVALAAPTGKAAARMTEALRDGLDTWGLDNTARDVDLRAFVAALEGKTLHRTLGFQFRSPTRFRHNRDNPLPHSAVIVDEASMIDLPLMAKLVDAVSPTARLLLLGDANQLVSVEAGTVLADIVGPLTLSHAATPADRGLPSCITLLDHNYRFTPDSGVGQFANACLRDDLDSAERAFSAAFEDTLRLDHAPENLLPPEADHAILSGYGAYLTTVFRDLPHAKDDWDALAARALAQLEMFRVLCAHRRGLHGVENLNAHVEKLLAARGTFPRRSHYRPTSPHYAGRPILIRDNAYDLNLFNGDTGLLVPDPDTPADSKALIAIFPTPTIPRRLHPARLPAHETCYATTIHKSQGSQHAHTLTLLPRQPSPLLTRNLVYTAITRTRVGKAEAGLPGVPSRAMLVADAAVLRAALRAEVKRASGLRELLWDAEGGR